MSLKYEHLQHFVAAADLRLVLAPRGAHFAHNVVHVLGCRRRLSPVRNLRTTTWQNVKRFRGELVVKAHGLLYHSTPGSRVIKKNVLDVLGHRRRLFPHLRASVSDRPTPYTLHPTPFTLHPTCVPAGRVPAPARGGPVLPRGAGAATLDALRLRSDVISSIKIFPSWNARWDVPIITVLIE